MDFWVFAAAAGAGCVAKYWQNAFRSQVLSSKLSSDACTHDNFQSWTSMSAHAPRKHIVEDACTSERDMDWVVSDFSSAGEMASTSGAEDRENVDSLEKTDASPLLPWCTEASVIEMCMENECRCDISHDIRGISGNACGETDGGKLGSSYGPAKMKNSLRSKYARAQYIKPMNSLESCLMAQLQGLHAEMEDRLLAPLSSPACSPIRPLLVTDGHQIIGHLSDGYLRAQDWAESRKLHKKAFVEKNKTVLGITPLPKVVSSSITKQLHKRSGKDKRMDGWSRMSHGKDLRSQTGPHHETVLFCLGISVGIMSSIVTNKKEVSKLKDLLRQTENLVQDLQEELEMKDSLTVKELASENYESQDTNNDSFQDMAPVRFSSKHSREDSGKCISREEHNGRAGETPDSMSKIEAELEAELERLGLNVTASRLGKKPPDKENEGASSTSTTHSTNYAVSPRELSLRLHEVIQSRLEKRIDELELALENSQQKVSLLESASKISRRESLIDKPQSITSHATPTFREEFDDMAQPLIMSLSGEALSAYVETYDELMKFDSEDEDSPSDLYEIRNHNDESWENGKANNAMTRLSCNEGGAMMELYSQIRVTNEDLLLSQRNSSACITGYESSDADEEKEKLLIRKIVEKTKRGSPAVLNAQRMFFSADEDEK